MDDDKIMKILGEIRAAEHIGDYSAINNRLIDKRLKWYSDNNDRLELEGTLVRQAYQLLIIEYLQIPPHQAEIIEERHNLIVWRSTNPCPVAEACRRGGYLGSDVCKKGWEEPVQKLIEQLDKNLYFTRDYSSLRPQAQFCEEKIYHLEPKWETH